MTPRWIQSPAVQQLLHNVVDRLDRAQAQGKANLRALKLDARLFPAMFHAELESEREELWGLVEQLCALGWISIKLDKAQIGQATYERNPRLEVLDAVQLRTAAGRLERLKGPTERWREAVFTQLQASLETREAVSRYLVDIPGRSPEEIVQQLNKLHTLANEPLLLREVSARLFWGQSKVLDNRQGLVAALLGVDECPFPEMPVQLQVFLPPDGFNGVLFIENLSSFERATREHEGRYKGLALVYAAGFKGSARRLRRKEGVSLYFAEHGSLASEERAKFKHWLFEGMDLQAAFWGDLDYAGMAILKSLRHSFPGLAAWEQGYAPMVLSLGQGRGHAPGAAGKSLQKPVDATGCDYADSVLLTTLRIQGRFADQEGF